MAHARAESPAAPQLEMVVVDIVADAQRHQVVDLPLHLDHQHDVQPDAVRLRLVAHRNPPDDVVGVAPLGRGRSGRGLLLYAHEARKIQPVDQFAAVVQVPTNQRTNSSTMNGNENTSLKVGSCRMRPP